MQERMEIAMVFALAVDNETACNGLDVVVGVFAAEECHLHRDVGRMIRGDDTTVDDEDFKTWDEERAVLERLEFLSNYRGIVDRPEEATFGPNSG